MKKPNLFVELPGRKFVRTIMKLTGSEVRFLAERAGLDLSYYNNKIKQAIGLCLTWAGSDFRETVYAYPKVLAKDKGIDPEFHGSPEHKGMPKDTIPVQWGTLYQIFL